MTVGKIDADALNRELDALNVELLELVQRGRALVDEGEALTEDMYAAGAIVGAQPTKIGKPPVFDADGKLTDPGTPNYEAGWIGPISAEQWTLLKGRIALLGKITKLIDEPIGNANLSYAKQLRKAAARFRVRGF